MGRFVPKPGAAVVGLVVGTDVGTELVGENVSCASQSESLTKSSMKAVPASSA